MDFNIIKAIWLVLILIQFTCSDVDGCQFYPVGEFMRFIRVPENHPVGNEILSISAYPRKNVSIQSIDNKGDIDYFIIKDVNDTSILITLSKSLEDLVDNDNPQNILKFRLSCDSTDSNDDTVSSYLTVTVYVEDINDHSPVFIDSPYRVVIDESTPVGLTIFRNIHAFDRDKPNTPNSDVEYNIVAGNEKGKFALNSNHRPYVITKKSLDYDTDDKEFNLTISASDRGTPPRATNSSLIITIQDSDDLNPTFTKGVYRTKINEFYPFTGEKINQKLNFEPEIFAFDQDVAIDSPVRYEIIAGNERQLFSLNRTNGRIYLQKQIDLDQEHTIPGNTFVLQIQALQINNNLKTALARVEIEILDLNDNQPEFKSDFYNISIVENLPNSFNVLNVNAIDADQGENAEFFYQMKNSEDFPFELDPKTGWLSVSDQNLLDRETKSSFSMRIYAIESKPSVIPNAEPSSTLVQINLLDANDNNPKFIPNNLYEFTIPANIKINDVVGAVKASDPDLGPNGVIKYSIQKTSSQNSSCPFTIDENTGKLFVHDSPLAEGKHGFFVEASDQSLNPSERRYSLAVVTIDVIRSETDSSNKAEFVGEPYEFWVSDDAEIGSNIGQIRVRNVNEREVLEYDLLHSYHEGVPFAIEEKSGTISVIDHVKRFQRSNYEFETVVVNQRKDVSLTTNVTIHVVDPNNMKQSVLKDQLNPIEYHVKENIAGALIGQIFYKNISKILQNRAIKFTIANQKDTNGKIIISQDGTLYTHESLDREEKDVYRLTIIAEYRNGLLGGTTIYQVVVYVDDENDNVPVFEHDLYEGRVKENCISGTEVDLNYAIHANDADSGANGQFVYTLFGEGSKMFRINKKSGKVYFISASAPLDREMKSVYHFRLVATDKGGESSQVKLIIRVLDENDNSPVFKKIILYPSLGLDVLSFSKGVSPKIDLIQESFNNRTTIQETRGVQYRSFVLHLSVPEDVEVGRTLMRLEAEDNDENENAILQYVLANENYVQRKPQFLHVLSRKEIQPHFMVHPLTGEISLTRFLQSQSQLVLNLTVKDSKFNSDFIRIKFSVKDINDHSPIFKMSFYTFDIYENVPINTTVGTIEAYDNEDYGDNARITYELQFSNNSDVSFPFYISANSGVIKVKRSLNREILDKFNFNVIAYDNPLKIQDRLNSTVEVQISILDVNDNSPQFSDYDELVSAENDSKKYIPVYYVNVAENCPIGTFIIKMEAKDLDLPDNGNGLFLYELSNNLTSSQDKFLFSIDSKEGHITTVGKLDYETSPVHNLSVIVTDFGSPRLSSTALVSVNVIDVYEDNSETIDKVLFKHQMYEIDVDENIPVPVKIVNLNVSDFYRNQALKYSLISEKNGHLKSFKIDPNNGTIFMVKSPDYEKVQQYELKVSVEKFKSPRSLPILIYPINHHESNDLAYNSAKVLINIKDINDNSPKFSNNGKPLITAIPANVPFGHSVLTLKAEDLDSGVNSKIYYQIINRGNDEYSRFLIDHDTGEIKTSSSFLNDAGKVFGFDVKATDNNGADIGKSSIANVFIYILDNDKQLTMAFRKKPLVLEKFLSNITAKLNKITGYDMRVQKIEPHHERNFVDDDITDMYIYAVDPVFNSIIPTEKLENQLREKKSLLRHELSTYDFNDIRYGALEMRQKTASLFFIFSLEFLILFTGALLIIAIIMTVYCFSYIRGIQNEKRAMFFQSKMRNYPYRASSQHSFKNLSFKSTCKKDELKFIEPVHSYSEMLSRTPISILSKPSHDTVGCQQQPQQLHLSKRASCLKKIDENDGFFETSAISLHSSGKDSGIAENTCTTPEKCQCKYCTSNSSDEFSNLSYEDSLKSECKIHGKTNLMHASKPIGFQNMRRLSQNSSFVSNYRASVRNNGKNSGSNNINNANNLATVIKLNESGRQFRRHPSKY